MDTLNVIFKYCWVCCAVRKHNEKIWRDGTQHFECEGGHE